VRTTLAALLLALSAPASAYQVYTTESQGQSAPPSCTLEQPRKLQWMQSTVGWHLEPAPEAQIDRELAKSAVAASFDTWNQGPDCDQPELVYQGAPLRAEAAFDSGDMDANENAVVWVTSGWDKPGGVLALTTLTFSTCSGEIVDADIEINAVHFTFSATAVPPSGAVDLRNTLTHEVGHLLGLDHELDDAAATMYVNAGQGETSKRDLEADDVAGLCCVYAPSMPDVVPDRTCEGAAQFGSTVQSAVIGDAPESMACSGTGGGAPTGVALALAALALGILRRQLAPAHARRATRTDRPGRGHARSR
jgi:hypothetical protein